MDEQTVESTQSVFDQQSTQDADTSQASGTEPMANTLQGALDSSQPDGPINGAKDPSTSPLNPNADCSKMENPPELLRKGFQWAQDKVNGVLPKGPIGDFLKEQANKLAPWNWRCPVDTK